MDELVSIVIPVYNVENYLERCLESVVNQTYKKTEIILINDGSTDSSREICQKWQQADDRIILIEKKNEGLGPARNTGIDKSIGKYIAFIDSDDWWEKDAVETLYFAAEKNDADMVYMNFYWEWMNSEGKYSSRVFCQRCSFEGVGNAEKYPGLVFSTDARTWSKFYRASLIKKNNIRFPNHPFEDFPINPLLVLLSKRICQVHRPLYHYECSRDGALTSKADSYKYIPKGLEELRGALISNGWNRYQKDFQKYAIRMCRGVLNEGRINRDSDVRVFSDFLEKYCGDFMEPYKKDIIYLGSKAGYQMIEQNAFCSQVRFSYLFDDDSSCLKDFVKFDNSLILIDLLNSQDDFPSEEIIQRLTLQESLVVILEFYYAKYHGENENTLKPFDDGEIIDKKNTRLKERYGELKRRLGRNCMLKQFDKFNNYTYEHTPYGCSPEYYNGKFYENAFLSIMD